MPIKWLLAWMDEGSPDRMRDRACAKHGGRCHGSQSVCVPPRDHREIILIMTIDWVLVTSPFISDCIHKYRYEGFVPQKVQSMIPKWYWYVCRSRWYESADRTRYSKFFNVLLTPHPFFYGENDWCCILQVTFCAARSLYLS